MAALFLPLDDNDVLVPGERVFYRRRRHAAVLLAPALDLGAAVILAAWLGLDMAVIDGSALVTTVAVAAACLLIRRILHVDWPIQRAAVGAAVVVVLAYALGLSAPGVVALVLVALVLRLAVRAVRWKWYQRLLITDRRVVELEGFFGSQVSTMPLGRITDAVLTRTPLAELLGYAEFRVESAGQDQALGRINFLDDAERFHSLIIQLSAGAEPAMPIELGTQNPPRYFDPRAV